MATLLTGQKPVKRTVEIVDPSSTNEGTVSLNTSASFFYSNNPETLDAEDLASSGKFLNRVDVTGEGQIYTWHRNGTGVTIKNCIVIYNFNSFPVEVEITNCGLSNRSDWLPDVDAWKSYFSGTYTRIEIKANKYENLFLSNIPNNNNFGIVAAFKVRNSNTHASATVTMFDLAYTLISSGADSFAPEDGSNRLRGLGSGYIASLRFPTLEPTAIKIPGVKIGSPKDDFFSGADCSYISNPSGTSGRLAGGYGQIFNISVPIKNITGSARKFRIFIGSNGGESFPFVLYGNSTASYTASALGHHYLDVIETDYIANNATTTVTFRTVITALASTPYVIGARVV